MGGEEEERLLKLVFHRWTKNWWILFKLLAHDSVALFFLSTDHSPFAINEKKKKERGRGNKRLWKASRAVSEGKGEAQERSVVCALIVVDRRPKKKS